jgi:hypothetical protein
VRLKGKAGDLGEARSGKAGEDHGPVVAWRWSEKEERKGGDRRRQVGPAVRERGKQK